MERPPHVPFLNKTRAMLLAGALVGSVAFGLSSPSEALASPLRQEIQIGDGPVINQKEITGTEREEKIRQFGDLILGFLTPAGFETIKQQGFYKEDEIKVRNVDTNQAQSTIFYINVNGQNRKIGVFENSKETIIRQAYIMTDKVGEDRLEEFTQATKSLLRQDAQFKEGSAVDDEDLEAAAKSSPEGGEAKQTKIYYAKIPSRAEVLRDPESNNCFTETNLVAVNAKGYFSLLQQRNIIFPSGEQII